MGQAERLTIIKKIQEIRGSKLICFITADRGGNIPQFGIADDAISPLYRQLESVGETNEIDLFLYTRGGSTLSAFRIAKLFCSYCKKFSVLIPHRCHSAGTLVAMAADEILMTKFGELSPVDPSVTSRFNPEDKAGIPKPISVEDVFGYMDLCEDKGGLVSESSKLETFRILSEKAHPLALGNVNRAYNEIRLLLEELLLRHMDKLTDQAKIEEIKHELTEVYSHFYIIDKKRAQSMNLKVVKDLDPTLEKLIFDLWFDYITELKVNEPFDVDVIYGTSDTPINVKVKHAIIESEASSECYVRNITIAKGTAQPLKIQLPGMPAPTIIVPHPSTIPTMVKFNIGKWADLQAVGDCV